MAAVVVVLDLFALGRAIEQGDAGACGGLAD